MRKTLKLCVLTAALAAILAGLAAAADVTAVNELVEHSLQWNGKTVAIEGEAIGEMLPRGDCAWVNVNDGTNAIGVWMPLADAKKIGVYGDYHHTGDTLRVTGTDGKEYTTVTPDAPNSDPGLYDKLAAKNINVTAENPPFPPLPFPAAFFPVLPVIVQAEGLSFLPPQSVPAGHLTTQGSRWWRWVVRGVHFRR